MGTTSFLQKRFWSKGLILMCSLPNITENSLHPFGLRLTMMRLITGRAAVTLERRYSHSLTYSGRWGSGLSAAMSQVPMHSSSQGATRSYFAVVPKETETLFLPPDYNWFVRRGHSPDPRSLEYFLGRNRGWTSVVALRHWQC